MPETRTLDVTAALTAYYTAYYRDTLGIPGWRDLVAVRLADEPYEQQRLPRSSARSARFAAPGC